MEIIQVLFSLLTIIDACHNLCLAAYIVLPSFFLPLKKFINPRRACAARVTVVGCVTSHLWSVCSSLKYCHVLSRQRRSKNML